MQRALKICIDLGSSLTKACYLLDGKIHWLCQENAVVQDRIRDLAGNSCLIEFAGKAWTVGASAIEGPQETNVHLKKASDASLRTLGMLGKVIEKEKLTDASVELNVLLPEGERRFFPTLEANLEKGFYGSTFNGLKPKLVLKKIRVLPEGAGIASNIKDREALVLMCGHKDISILFVSNGQIVPDKSLTLTGKGMIALVKRCGINISSELILSTLICREVKNKNGLRQQFTNKDDLASARLSLKSAKQQVWQRLSDSLDRFPDLATASKIFVTGGSFPVWTPELKKKYGPKLRFFKDELEQMSAALPELNTPELTGYKNRFTDSYLFIKGIEA